jgi:hypothetical protein
MKSAELTCRSRTARNPGMGEIDNVDQGCCDEGEQPAQSMGKSIRATVLAFAGALAVSGCISVNAPDKPIVIELNMNITMDVVYKLSGDATKTVDTNKDIF